MPIATGDELRFPGGKIERDVAGFDIESLECGLAREMKQELGIVVVPDTTTVINRRSHLREGFDLVTFRVRVYAGTPQPVEYHRTGATLEWWWPSELVCSASATDATKQTLKILLSSFDKTR